MPTTDTTERGLENLIVTAMTGRTTPELTANDVVCDVSIPLGRAVWILGDAKNYDREYAVDLVQLRVFLLATPKDTAEALDLNHASPIRQKFLARLQGEITKRVVIDVLRHGIKHGPHHLNLFYGTPSPGNESFRRWLTDTIFALTYE
jgi:type I restriction enzyme R subunit